MNLELTTAERLTLQELSIHHRYADFRRRALGLLALAKGHPLPVVADILGVTPQTVYNWGKAWRTRGLMGLLDGHQGGAPTKLTATLLDTAEAIARAAPATLAQIARHVHEAHPEAPDFSLDRLSAGLRARGLAFTRTRLSLKKDAARSASKRPAST
jgi:transposase